MGLAEGMPVLIFHDHLTVLGDGDDVDPVGKLHDVPCRYLLAAWHFHTLLPYGQPRSETQDILAFNDLPRPVFQFRIHIACKITKIPPYTQI